MIHHDEHHDERKCSDLAPGREDIRKLFTKWDLPEKGSYLDPAPAYQEMLCRRNLTYQLPVAQADTV